jgi:hypothetical protein
VVAGPEAVGEVDFLGIVVRGGGSIQGVFDFFYFVTFEERERLAD